MDNSAYLKIVKIIENNRTKVDLVGQFKVRKKKGGVADVSTMKSHYKRITLQKTRIVENAPINPLFFKISIALLLKIHRDTQIY